MSPHDPTPHQPFQPHLQRDAEGRFAWEAWKQRALVAGLEPDLADRGREVMRESAMHDWTPALQAECGWNDQGRAMLRRALREPLRTRRRWEWLMDTDGERGFPDETGAWRFFSACTHLNRGALRLLERAVTETPLTEDEWSALRSALSQPIPSKKGDAP